MAKTQGQNIKRGDQTIPRPADVKTNGVRANIVGTCPRDGDQYDESFGHKLPSPAKDLASSEKD